MPLPLQVAEQLFARGFAVIPRFMPGVGSADAFASLGVIDVVDGLNAVQTLKPHCSDESPPNTYSGNFGTAEFPPHTDLAHWAAPPRFVGLRCVHGAVDVTTRLWDGKALLSSVGVEALRRALVQPRRPLRNGKQLLRLLERNADSHEYMLRWDSLYLRPATRWSEQVFAESLRHLSSVASIDVMLLDAGDMLIVDNWRVLHGRSSTPAITHHRHIDRAYLRELR